MLLELFQSFVRLVVQRRMLYAVFFAVQSVRRLEDGAKRLGRGTDTSGRL